MSLIIPISQIILLCVALYCLIQGILIYYNIREDLKDMRSNEMFRQKVRAFEEQDSVESERNI